MYLAKQLTSRSLPEIGRKFGGRDHTTVMHDVPGQCVRVGATQMQNQRWSWPRLTPIPCRTVALLVFRAEGKRVFVQHQLEAAPA